jgi:hypothetical protein
MRAKAGIHPVTLEVKRNPVVLHSKRREVYLHSLTVRFLCLSLVCEVLLSCTWKLTGCDLRS